MSIMVKVYKLDDCPLSERAGTYGGQAGFKDGIVWNNENWLVKYPKTMSDMRAPDMSYTTSPLSEYIGSKIYQALGYDTHEVQLGYRNDKIVVVCKDFCENEGALREVRTIKNLANPKNALQFREF